MFFKSAYHIPLLIHWPGQMITQGTNISQFVSLADIAPTILSMAKLNNQRKFSGYNLFFCLGNDPENWREVIFTQTNGNELYGI